MTLFFRPRNAIKNFLLGSLINLETHFSRKFLQKTSEKKYETKEDVKPLVNDLKNQLDEIKEINLSSNVFKPEAMEELCKYIVQLKNLEIAIFAGIFATLVDEEMTKCFILLSNALADKGLIVLDLSNNALSANLPAEFISLLSNANTLKGLKLRNCGLGKDGGNVVGRCLSNLADKTNLDVVDMAQNRFFEFPKELEKGLLSLKNLKDLRLEYNTIEKNSMTEFLKKITQHPLEVLDIRDNSVTFEGCETLGRIFRDWNIRELYIGACLMKNEGVKAFLDIANEKYVPLSLPGSISTKLPSVVLDITFNEVEQDCVDQLIEFCKKNDVKLLRVYDNYIEDFSELIRIVQEKGGSVECEDPLLMGSEEPDTIGKDVIEMLEKIN